MDIGFIGCSAFLLMLLGVGAVVLIAIGIKSINAPYILLHDLKDRGPIRELTQRVRLPRLRWRPQDKQGDQCDEHSHGSSPQNFRRQCTALLPDLDVLGPAA